MHSLKCLLVYIIKTRHFCNVFIKIMETLLVLTKESVLMIIDIEIDKKA